MEEKDDVCPICFEDFKNPKLLPCRHSFCACCIKDLVLTKPEFLCPNCRSIIHLPPGGVDEFMSNYFIQSAPEEIYCHFCKNVCKGRCLKCETCLRNACPSCFIQHGEDTECNESDSEQPGEIYRCLTQSRQCTINTVYEAEVSTSFQQDQFDKIVKLVPSLFGEQIWIAKKHNHILEQYDRSGKTMNNIYANGVIVDFCTHIGNSILVTYENSHVVMKVTQSEESVFIRHEHGYPKYITCLKQRMVVVATKKNKNTRNDYDLFYYAPNGDYMTGYPLSRPFKHISGLCFNTVTKQLCVSDRKSGSFHLLSSDGNHYVYSGHQETKVADHHGRSMHFVPQSATCDADGNTFIFDKITRLIHIIDQSAKLIALMGTDDEQYVQPNHLAFDISGKLWISDTQDKKIKVYKVKKCANYFRPRSHRLHKSVEVQRRNVIVVPMHVYESLQSRMGHQNNLDSSELLMLLQSDSDFRSGPENTSLPPSPDQSYR